jgi:hypothetical protein
MAMSVGSPLIAAAATATTTTATVAAVAVSAAVAVVVMRGVYKLPIMAFRIECVVATSPSRGISDRGGIQRCRQEQCDGGRCHDGKSAATGKEFAARCERVRFGRRVGRLGV